MKNTETKRAAWPIAAMAIVFLLFMGQGLSAQSLGGPTSVNQGSTYNYYIYATGVQWSTWYATGATIMGSYTTSASIRWDTAGSQSVSASFQDAYNYYYKTLNVSVTGTAPSTPGNPTISSNGCGSATLQRSGTPPSGVTWYWQGKTSSGTSTTKGSGSTYTPNEGNGTYYIRARNGSGQWSSGSGSVSVTIANLTAGSINGAQTIVYNGDPSTLGSSQGAGGTSGSYTYQWQRSANGTSGWTDLVGANSSTYDPPSGLAADRWFRRKVTCSSQTAYTGTIKVTVNPPFVAGSISGAQTIINGGDPSVLSNNASASGGDGSYAYQWQYSNNGSSGWTNISGATSTSYNPPSGLTADRWYRRRAISFGETKYTGNVKVTVNPVFVAGSISGAQTIVNGGNPTTLSNSGSASGGDGSYAYQWQFSNNGSSSWTDIGSATATTYNPPGGLTADRWYRREAVSFGETKYTGNVKVTVNPVFDPGDISGTQTITSCNGNPSLLSNASSASGGDGSYAYQWQYSSNGSSGWTDISGATATTYDPPSGLSVSRWYRREAISFGETKYTSNVVVTVTPPTDWYADTDGDGFGDAGTSTSDCSQPAGYVANDDDHDDTTANITNITPQTYYRDLDGDGFGDAADTGYFSFVVAGYVANNTDGCPTSYGDNNGCSYTAPTLSDENYVYTRNFQIPITDADNPALIKDKADVIEQVGYFDGLGRPMQNIAIRAGGTPSINSNVAEWDMDWTVGTGSTGFFNQNGSTSENERLIGTDPFGEQSLLWRAGNDVDYNGDGGWNTDYFNVDKDATYSYSVWVKRTHSQDGKTYHGTQNVDNLSGGANSNPYFWSGDLPQLNTWYLMVGVVHPTGYSGGDTGVSGVYDLQGNKVIDGTEFKWGASTTTARFRSYLYYSVNTDVRQYFFDPVIQKIDGSEAAVAALAAEGRPSDIVTHMDYDAYGRQNKEWLPYHEPSGNLGSYRGDVSTPTQQYYLNNFTDDFSSMLVADVNAFSEKNLEASPLSRVLEQAAPGKDWKLGNNNEIGFAYQTNDTSEVGRYDVTTSLANNTYTPTLVANGYYPEGELYKTVTYDENHATGKNHSTEEYKDKRGQVVLKRSYESSVAHDTYYVYDDYGNLTFVIPPLVDTSDGVSASELSELCYQYVYDDRNRLVEKKIPGKGWEYIIYNKLDQPILTQDANLEMNDEWLFTKYDAFGRVAYTGVYDHGSSATREEVQLALENYYTNNPSKEQYEEKLGSAGSYMYYSNDAYPTSNLELLTANYYDSYTFDKDGLSVPATVQGQTTISGTSLKGLPTGSKVKVLGTTTWNTTLMGYDSKRRAVYTASRNDYLGMTDVTETRLDFVGKVLETRTSHAKDTKDPLIVHDQFAYDHQGRLRVQNQTIDGTTQTVVQNTYSDLGQLQQKEVGGGVDYVMPELVDRVATSTSGNVISSTASSSTWGTSGFATAKTLVGDGYVEWRAAHTNKAIMVGLSTDNTDASFNTIDYAIYMRYDGTVRVYENGIQLATYSNYAVGDIFRVERFGDTITYLHNNVLIHTSTVTTTQPLMGDVAMGTVGATFEDLRIADANVWSKATPLQTVDYSYNVRGWLKQINDPSSLGSDLFGFELRYNDPTDFGGNEDPDALYNGNISQTYWKTLSTNTTGNPVSERYSYEYDALNRITAAFDNTNNYTLSIVEYDKNGNIDHLARRGAVNAGATSFNSMDNMTYTYDSGNKLLKINELNTKSFGFTSQYSGSADQYAYDANGNMTMDLNKNIASNGITYNHLNLPTQVTINSDNITYIYDATGVKLKKTVSTGGTTEYAGNYIYENNTLQFFNHAEGYIEPDGSGGYDYIYQYKDHLGNVRLSYTDANNDGTITVSSDPMVTEIIKESNYYPFGLKHSGYNTVQNGRNHKYGFGGKEEQDDDLNGNSVDWLDFGARNYDAALGRWMNLDPLAEMMRRHSPYNYAFDNPIFFVDPDGMAPRGSSIFWGFGGDEQKEDEEDEGEDNSEKSSETSETPDDIIFRNKEGKELGRIVTAGDDVNIQVDTDTELPEPIVVNLEAEAEKLGLDVEDVDAAGIDLGANGVLGGGLNYGLAMVYFFNGDNSEEAYLYGYFGGGIGLEGSAGASGFLSFFDDQAKSEYFNVNSFVGKYNGYSGGVGAIGGSYVWSNEANVYGEFRPNQKSQKTWGSYGLGATYSGKAKAGLSVIWGNSAIWAKLTTNTIE